MLESGISSLSRQQRRCLEAVGRGLTTAEIAHELSIAESTVNSHIEAATRKLGSANRRQAAYRLQQLEAKPPQNLPSENLRFDTAAELVPITPSSNVREQPTVFAGEPCEMLGQDGSHNGNDISVVGVVVRIIAIAICIMLLLISLDPLVRGAAKLAETIDPPPH